MDCPMSYNRTIQGIGGAPVKCREDRCAWWVAIGEAYNCAVRHLAALIATSSNNREVNSNENL